MKQKGRPLSKTSREGTKSYLDPLISRAHLHAKHSHLKPLVKKKGEGGKVKGDTKDFDFIKGNKI
jgi:hypothetical protein